MNSQALLTQCQSWYEQNQYQKIIDELDAIDAEERRFVLDNELARSYAQFGSETRNLDLLYKAKELLELHQAEGEQDVKWNFCLGFTLSNLDRPAQALQYFQKALQLGLEQQGKEDEDTSDFCDLCQSLISHMKFISRLRERTHQIWDKFVADEQQIRQLIDVKSLEEAIELVSSIIRPSLGEVTLELGYNGTKYDLILSPEGNPVFIFALAYFAEQVPSVFTEHWNVIVGRPALPHDGLRLQGYDIGLDNVQVWCTVNENTVALQAYNPQLTQLNTTDENQAYWLLCALVDLVLGEVVNMYYIDSIDLLEVRLDTPSIMLNQLGKYLQEQGVELNSNVAELLENRYVAYEATPAEEFSLRKDIGVGISRCRWLHDDFFFGEKHGLVLENCGAAAGFIAFSIAELVEDDNFVPVFELREKLINNLLENCADSCTLVGMALGLELCYIDLLIWDIEKVFSHAQSFLANTPVSFALFGAFNQEAVPMILKILVILIKSSFKQHYNLTHTYQ